MSGPGATPLFVDTGALYARFDEDDQHHQDAMAVFRGIATGDLVYRPLYVGRHVLAELATLVLQNSGPSDAAKAVDRIRESELFTIVSPSEDGFDVACQAMHQYDDQAITLTDHLTSVLADGRSVEYIFAFDSDFQTLGFELVPDDTGDLARVHNS
ncbi:MAG: type II toxin-antitoxin system VapC family toxin [Halapricum sp.]